MIPKTEHILEHTHCHLKVPLLVCASLCIVRKEGPYLCKCWHELTLVRASTSQNVHMEKAYNFDTVSKILIIVTVETSVLS
jgi:hypothetical protein